MVSARSLKYAALLSAVLLGGCATGSRIHSHHVPRTDARGGPGGER